MKESWYVLPARAVGRALRAIEARGEGRSEGTGAAEAGADEAGRVLLVLMPERDGDPEP